MSLLAKVICHYRGCRFNHIMNFRDIKSGRAIYQCSRCMIIDVEMPSEYHDKQKKNGIATRMNHGTN